MDNVLLLLFSGLLTQTLLLVACHHYYRRETARLHAEKKDLQDIISVSSDHSDFLASELRNSVADKQAALTHSLQVLNCLYKTSQLLESYPTRSLEYVFAEMVQLLKSTLKHSDIRICLMIYNERFQCENTQPNLWNSSFSIRVEGEEIGHLTICYNASEQLTRAEEEMCCEICVQVGNLLARKKKNEDLYRLAHNDYLTRLPSRYAFNKLVTAKIKQQEAKPSDELLAILFLDLDRFKTINDSIGHQHGDMLLKILAERFKNLLNGEDVTARLGGDEFIFMVLAQNRLDLQAFARRLLDAIKKPSDVGGRNLSISGSLGIAIYPEDGTNVEHLVQHADVAVYHAKRAGRNTFQFYQAQMKARNLELLALESDLRTALERQELLLYYQPQFSMQTGQLEGCEALLRWYAPGRGMVSPATFITLAEETGLIVPIGEWILKTAFQQLKHWHEAGHAYLTMAVNVSSLQFREDNFVEQAITSLINSGLAVGSVELEITESSIIQDIDLAIQKITTLKNYGFRISIDDFGTGYSSLNYLKQFPFDKLKVDCSFVRDLTPNSDDEAITKTIVMLGRNLHLKVIAEGVETQQQYELLKSYGTDSVQGYLTGKPQEASVFAQQFLARPLALVNGIHSS